MLPPLQCLCASAVWNLRPVVEELTGAPSLPRNKLPASHPSQEACRRPLDRRAPTREAAGGLETMSILAREIGKRKIALYWRTALLAALMVLPLLALGRTFFGPVGFVAIGIAIVVLVAQVSRQQPGRVLENAIPLRYYEAPQLHEVVSELSSRAGLTTVPMIYLIPSQVPNAATIGRADEAVLIVTDGLLRRLSIREVAGVLAHEISHIRNNDLTLFAFAEVVKHVTILLARFTWFFLLLQLPLLVFSGQMLPLDVLLLVMAAPLLVFLIQLALLRNREFQADLGAVELTGDPKSLASALYRIENPVRSLCGVLLPVPQPQDGGLFRTHPSSQERIRRLLDLG